MTQRPESNWPSLPPREFWLIDPGEKVDTPIDNRDIVDIEQTIALVKSLITPGYDWDPELDVHHFPNPARNYPNVHEPGQPNPAVFKDLPIHKGLLYREFHNFLHAVLRHPPTPTAEVMRYRIESWNVAASLFQKARATIRWERLRRDRRALIAANPQIVPEGFNGQDIIGEEIMQEIFERNFRGLDFHLERNSCLPPEFQLFDSSAPVPEIAATIGRVAVPRSVPVYRLLAA